MFKRSLGRSNHQQVAGGEAPNRVDKSARLMKKATTASSADYMVVGGGGLSLSTSGGGTMARAGSVRDQKKQQQRLTKQLQRSFSQQQQQFHQAAEKTGHSKSPLAPSPIVTMTVGREGRLFAAHEDVLCASPFFEAACRSQFLEAQQSSKRIALPDEEPEVFSAVLEYLYKGDYYPRLLHNKHRNSWELEDSIPASSSRRTPQVSPNLGGSPATAATGSPFPSAVEATVYVGSAGAHLLRDTVIYCAAERYGLEELKQLALRKQGLQAGIDVGTILRSAQYCYAHTPDSDSRLRAHYLALIIRCRRTFKRSGTMQAEMERGTAGGEGGGGKLFFDLFVALCNHLDDVIEASNKGSPRTI